MVAEILSLTLAILLLSLSIKVARLEKRIKSLESNKA